MKKKRVWIIALILVVVLILTNMLMQRAKDTETVVLPKDTTPEAIVPLTFASSTKTVANTEYEVSFDFPVTNNDRVNQTLNTFVDETIAAFEKDIDGFGPNPFPDRKYTMQSWFESRTHETYTSFVFLISVDTGGAHPNHLFSTFTFDERGEVVSLDKALQDVFGVSNGLDHVAELSREILWDELGESAEFGWIDDGTKPAPENFADFYLESDELVIMFEPYAIGPYAWSSRIVRLSREALTGVPVMSETASTTPETITAEDAAVIPDEVE
jgi:hypothetical protein